MTYLHVAVVVIKLERLHSRVLDNLLYQLCYACIKYLNLNVESYLFGCVFLIHALLFKSKKCQAQMCDTNVNTMNNAYTN